MDNLEELTNVGSKNSFFRHVFHFNEDDKGELMNIVQYALLAIIPVVLLNKTMQKYVPEADDEKGSVEISAEVIFQIVFMFFGIYMIHRVVTFLPTYGGLKYQDFSVTTIILTVLVITLSLQTKLGEKVSILVDRVVQLWEGDSGASNKKKKQSTVKVSQPISQPGMHSQQIAMTMPVPPSPLNSGSTPISQLPMDKPAQNYDNSSQNSYGSGMNSQQVQALDGFNQGPLPASEFMGFNGGFANF
jgi:hypothetical protein